MDKEFLSQIDQVAELIAPEAEKLADDVLICECFCVSVGDIREACRDLGTFDLELVQNNFSLGHGCQSCLKQIDSWSLKIF
jgi:NAD(P)H-nitrite reductase large subunit